MNLLVALRVQPTLRAQRGTKKVTARLQRLSMLIGEFTELYRRDERVERWLQDQVRKSKYDFVVSRYLWPALASGMVDLQSVARVLDWDDVDHRRFQASVRSAPWPGLYGRVGSALIACRIRMISRAAARKFNHVWVTKPSDLQDLHGRSASILPNIPFCPPQAMDDVELNGLRSELLFVGDLSYQPNIDGFGHFLASVWPMIKGRVPTARIQCVGIPPPKAIANEWVRVDGLIINGVAEELLHFYQRTALSVCPIQWGGGTNIKAIESLAYGVPVVMYPHTFEGYRHHFGASSGMFVAHSDEQFAETCVSLLLNAEIRRSAGNAGRTITASRYSLDSFRNSVQLGLQAALANEGQS